MRLVPCERLRAARAWWIDEACGEAASNCSTDWMKASPEPGRLAGSFAIRESISGCSHRCSGGRLGTGCVTCINATVKGSAAW
jgi:hypothetical protein